MNKLIITATIIALHIFITQNLYASEKLKLAASIYPLAHFAEQVGGKYAEVINITPTGAEPHDYEPTLRDMQRVWTSKIFIFHGAGLDPWAEKIHKDLQREGILTVMMSKHFDLLRTEEGGKYDPHIWLDPLLAQKEIEIIRDAFIKADPERVGIYKKNSAAYIDKLDALHNKYKESLKSCKIRHIVVSHNAFSYLAERYNLKTHSISSLSPDEEPSPRKMMELVRFARKKNIKYIFFEVLVSPKIAETIARELGAKTLLFHPIEGLTKNGIRAGKTYISIMEENLHNLRLALSCN